MIPEKICTVYRISWEDLLALTTDAACKSGIPTLQALCAYCLPWLHRPIATLKENGDTRTPRAIAHRRKDTNFNQR